MNREQALQHLKLIIDTAFKAGLFHTAEEASAALMAFQVLTTGVDIPTKPEAEDIKQNGTVAAK